MNIVLGISMNRTHAVILRLYLNGVLLVSIETITSLHLCPAPTTDEQWTGLGLEPEYDAFCWIRIVPDCYFLHEFRIRTGFGLR